MHEDTVYKKTVGPYIKVDKGHYRADIYGNGLSNCDIEVTDSGLGRHYSITKKIITDTHITVYFELTDDLRNKGTGLEVVVLHDNESNYSFSKEIITRLEDRVLVAGGGGGAASHTYENSTDKRAYGGNGGTPDGKNTNTYTDGGKSNSGYALGLGQDGYSCNSSSTNCRTIAGAGGGWYGGKILSRQDTDQALGGAGGSSYYDRTLFTNVDNSIANNHLDGSYKIYEVRDVVTIDKSSFDKATSDLLMKYYNLIPDKVNGEDNPIWANCTKEFNTHVCDDKCTVVKVLTCTEPHHKGLHYDVSNPICWEACNNDANHKTTNTKITDLDFEPGNFINLDYGFTIIFPNRGNFEEGQPYGIGALTSQRGKSYTNVYKTTGVYGAGTTNCGKYKDTDVGMNTTKWTRVKRIKFDIDVIYNNKLYLKGEWIYLGDRGKYNGTIGKIGDDKKYDETKWSNYGTDLYDGIYKDEYDFYCVLENAESKASHYIIEVTSLNASDFNSTGNGQNNDNKNEMTNKNRSGSFSSLHGGINSYYYDVVGRIGNLMMQDVEDFRFSNMFKQTTGGADDSEDSEIWTKKYDAKTGLSLKDSVNTENNAKINSGYVVTQAANSYAAVKDFETEKAYYKIQINGKGLNAGRLVVQEINGLEIDEDLLELIQSSSSIVSYYLDLSEQDINSIDVVYMAKASNVMAISDISITRLGDSPDDWWLDGVIKEVDESKPRAYLGWIADIRGITASSKTHWFNTWGSLKWMDDIGDDRGMLPLSPDKNNITILKDDPMLVGYAAYMDIQTIGNYWDNDTGRLTIIPTYYLLDITKADTEGYQLEKLDAYMEHDGQYLAINRADNINKNKDATSLYIKDVYNNEINLDWLQEKARRNVTDEEEYRTTEVYKSTLRSTVENNEAADINNPSVDADTYKPVLTPGGHINIIGNNQFVQLTGEARTFVGGESTYGNLKDIGNRIEDIYWYRNAQRWHFTVGLPSSTVFVRHDEEVTTENILSITEGDNIILCTLDITVKGEKYALSYKQQYSGSEANDSKGTDTGTKGEYMGDLKIERSDGTFKTIELNKFAKQLEYNPIVFVYSVKDDAGKDIEIIGTH